MTDQTTPTQDVAQPTEAGFSTNMYLKHPKMGRLQFTFRGANSRDWGTVLEDVDRFAHFMSGKGWKFDGESEPAPAQPPAPQVVRQPIDDGGNELPEVKSFIVERLSVEMRDGKFHYKVLGKPFTQYGVTAWPEVLIAAHLGVNDDGSPAWGNPPTPPQIAGWKAEYIEKLNDKGKMVPAKVTRLLPGKAPF